MSRGPRVAVGLVAALLAASAFTAGACSYPETRAEARFALLYSTSGYEAAGSKRAVVRGLDAATREAVDADRSHWSLRDEAGEVLAEGRLRARGDTFGSPLWEIDFSESTATGEALHLEVRLAPAEGAASGDRRAAHTLVSPPFPVERRLFSRRFARGLSLHNARLRRAPAHMGGGYYDCNSQMGEAYSHAMFAAGLIELERFRGVSLAADERAQLRVEIHRSVDYVLALHDAATGEIRNQHASRPFGNAGFFNTQEGVYGLAQYLALGGSGDATRSAEIDRRVRTSLAYLERHGELYPELGAAVWARLHAQSGRAEDLAQGAGHVEILLATFAPRTRLRHPLRGVPWFEGMALLAPSVPPPQRARWMEHARAWSRALVEAAGRNGYGVVPPLGEAEWDDMARAPVSSVEHAFFANAHFLATTVDALWLAELTGDTELEGVAAAGLQWVTGVNPGFERALVTGPPARPDEPSFVAASFVVNGPGRHVLPWQRWWWQGFADSPEAQTTVNGFVAPPQRGLVYDTAEWQPAETFIRTDALLLRAALRYEDRLGAP